MVCMYLLGNKDHYKSHEFTSCYWRNYVQWVRNTWRDKGEDPAEEMLSYCDGEDEHMLIGKKLGRYIVMLHVQDYVERPHIYDDDNLYN